ncbi:MAG: nitroreductase family protein [Bacteroidaceae bacterium]|nr:nitroreductase family protein [Bacteroidaceae bacterium]
MKNIIDTLLQRTSIRRYEMQPIEPEKLSLIYQAINNAPSSYNGQQYSVIAIDNQPLKEQIYALTGQKQIKTCALFLVFCSDYHKIEVATRQKELSLPPFQRTLDGILVGVIDATIAMSNARVMAEALGLGCCCIGYIRTAAPRELSDLLQLPKGVAIVCGLAIGHPREQPDKRPKQDEALVIHHNQYHTNGMSELLARHDRNIALYNHSHSIGTTDKGWAIHMTEYYKEGMSYHTLDYYNQQGYGVVEEYDV